MINCKEFVLKRKETIKGVIDRHSTKPSFCIVQVGNNEASNRYVRNKINDCREVGIEARLVKLPEDVTTEGIITKINKVVRGAKHNKDCGMSMMVQLPLPSHIDDRAVLDSVPVEYDVDGLSDGSKFTPCTPKGVTMLLDDLNYDVKGKLVTIIGKSDLVGKPLINLMLDRQATVASLNSSTNQMYFDELVQHAHVVVSAVGRRNLLDSKIINPNQLVIDIGINFDEDGKICGDCNKELYDTVDMITPVPAGMGLYTRVALLENIVEAYYGL